MLRCNEIIMKSLKSFINNLFRLFMFKSGRVSRALNLCKPRTTLLGLVHALANPAPFKNCSDIIPLVGDIRYHSDKNRYYT